MLEYLLELKGSPHLTMAPSQAADAKVIHPEKYPDSFKLSPFTPLSIRKQWEWMTVPGALPTKPK
jgi:hypothetical protein